MLFRRPFAARGNRACKKLRINLRLVDEVGDLDGVGGFDLDFFEILVAQRDPFPFFVLEAFDDLVGRNLFLIGLGDFL